MHSYLDQIILTYKHIVYIIFSFFYFTAQYMSMVAISSVIIILLYCVRVKLVKGKTCCYHEFQHFIIRNTTKSNATLSEQYLNTTQNLERMVQCQHRSPQDIIDELQKQCLSEDFIQQLCKLVVIACTVHLQTVTTREYFTRKNCYILQKYCTADITFIFCIST